MFLNGISATVLPCTSNLGVQLGNISNAQITATSSKGTAYPYLGRLSSSTHWAADVADQTQWIQVTFYSKTEVTGVIVQGRPGADEWIMRYKVSYSLDGPTWEFVLGDNNTMEVKFMKLNSRTHLVCVFRS